MNSSEIAISITNLSQEYKLYGSKREMTFDLLGIYQLMPWFKKTFKTHQALQNINLNIRKNERVGVIGRNGAGKSTLLKLITGNFRATAGSIVVNGRLQSLMDQGVGFHPEFTGRQNIRTALLYNGISVEEQRFFEEDIIEFAELGEYIDQPIKTYSLGMKARLGFAAATAIRPDVLVVDEVLGAGDAYFSTKSALRMKNLTQTGCTLVLVSHSNAQIMQFCERVIWIESGRIVMDGDPLEVTRAYDKFIREMENEKLREVNETSTRPVAQLMAAMNGNQSLSRWHGSNLLKIDGVRILDSENRDRQLFKTGEKMSVEIDISKHNAEVLPCIATVYVYTVDGLPLTLFVSNDFSVVGDRASVRVTLDKILFGNGEYVFTVALYSELDFNKISEAKFYDLIDRSYHFKVYFDYEMNSSKFQHPCKWELNS